MDPLNETVENHSLNYDSKSLSDFVHQFNSGLSAILNVHAPEKLASINVWHSEPWYSDALRDQRKTTRKRESIWRKF